jgi:Ca2+/H+ antiporter
MMTTVAAFVRTFAGVPLAAVVPFAGVPLAAGVLMAAVVPIAAVAVAAVAAVAANTHSHRRVAVAAVGVAVAAVAVAAVGLDCGRSARRRKAFRCACGGKVDRVSGIGMQSALAVNCLDMLTRLKQEN